MVVVVVVFSNVLMSHTYGVAFCFPIQAYSSHTLPFRFLPSIQLPKCTTIATNYSGICTMQEEKKRVCVRWHRRRKYCLSSHHCTFHTGTVSAKLTNDQIIRRQTYITHTHTHIYIAWLCILCVFVCRRPPFRKSHCLWRIGLFTVAVVGFCSFLWCSQQYFILFQLFLDSMKSICTTQRS